MAFKELIPAARSLVWASWVGFAVSVGGAVAEIIAHNNTAVGWAAGLAFMFWICGDMSRARIRNYELLDDLLEQLETLHRDQLKENRNGTD